MPDKKKVNNDAICPINVISEKYNQLQNRPDKFS